VQNCYIIQERNRKGEHIYLPIAYSEEKTLLLHHSASLQTMVEHAPIALVA